MRHWHSARRFISVNSRWCPVAPGTRSESQGREGGNGDGNRDEDGDEDEDGDRDRGGNGNKYEGGEESGGEREPEKLRSISGGNRGNRGDRGGAEDAREGVKPTIDSNQQPQPQDPSPPHHAENQSQGTGK